MQKNIFIMYKHSFTVFIISIDLFSIYETLIFQKCYATYLFIDVFLVLTVIRHDKLS